MSKSARGFRQSQEFWLVIVTATLVVVLSILRPNFLSLQNLLDLLSSYSYTGMLVLALFVVLIAGGIDISFAAVATAAQYAALAAANSYHIGYGLDARTIMDQGTWIRRA